MNELTLPYICRYMCSGKHMTEGALHDLNYPEMHRAEEKKHFNWMSQSKNPLMQPLICTSSASEAIKATDMYTLYSCVRL